MNRERLDAWCERGLLGLVVAILVFGPLALGAVRASEFLVLQALTLGVMLLWLGRIWINPRAHLLWPPVSWGVLAFALYAIGRYCFADIEYVAREELVRVLLYAFLFFACVNNLYRQESVRIVVFALIFLAMAEASYAMYQFITDSPRVWHFTRPEGYWQRGSGTYICPNNLAGFLEMLLPLGVAYTVMARASAVAKVLLAYATLAIAVGIVVSVSRAGWVSAAFGLAFMLGLVLRHGRNWLAMAAIVGVVLGAGVWFYSKSIYMQTRLGNGSQPLAAMKNDLRFGTSLAAWRMWKDHLWFGVGPAHYEHRFRAYRDAKWWMQGRPVWAHNDYLNTLADWGLVGGALVALTIFTLAGLLVWHWKSLCRAGPEAGRRSTGPSCFVIGASAGLIALLVHSIADFNMHIPANAILAVTLLALLSAHLRYATDRHWVKMGWLVRAGATVLLLAGLVFLGAQGWRRARAEIRLRQARAWPALSRERLAALEQAFAAEPRSGETASELGEQWRLLAWRGEDNYREQAARASEWFQRAARLNPFDSVSRLGAGMCLDWIDRHAEAEFWYHQALALDPNGFRTLAALGWHYFQAGDYAAAVAWFNKSVVIDAMRNRVAETYLPLALQKLAEQQKSSPPK